MPTIEQKVEEALRTPFYQRNGIRGVVISRVPIWCFVGYAVFVMCRSSISIAENVTLILSMGGSVSAAWVFLAVLLISIVWFAKFLVGEINLLRAFVQRNE